MFNGKTQYKWPFSLAMFDYQRVDHLQIDPSKLVVSPHSPGEVRASHEGIQGLRRCSDREISRGKSLLLDVILDSL